MSGFGYSEILTSYLIPFAKSLFGNQAIFHQDNAATHRTFHCMNLMNISHLRTIKAPAYSPDLNPIELMWADMKNFIAECRCQNDDDVNAAISAYASTVTPEKCTNWINHMKHYVSTVSMKYLNT